jgi:hypothetical protein
MPTATQISAHVSPATIKALNRYVRATGIKKGHLIEQALLHHLQALQELPAEYIVHPRIVVTRESGEKMVGMIEHGESNDALRELMRDGD